MPRLGPWVNGPILIEMGTQEEVELRASVKPPWRWMATEEVRMKV